MRRAAGPTRFSRRAWTVLGIVILTLICALWIYPFLWLASASLKSPLEIFSKGLNLVPDALNWQNYQRAWGTAGFGIYLLNTALITVGTVALVIFHTSLSGYVLGRYDFIGRRFVIGVIVGTFVIPIGMGLIPVVDLTQRMGLLNSRIGVTLALAGSGHAAAILLYTGFFRQLPKELEEAAIIDGAGVFEVFRTIMLPLAGPVTATVAVLTFLAAWNSFLLPLVLTFGSPDKRTLAVGMLAFVGTNETDWPGMAAAAMIALLPVITFFFFVQRYFVEGVAGAVKS
ncbi:carbohydrate ABC transporter permease [Pelagovum pacificum]|uniref:sn-glycerol-3-phosphate transport system permease protein UgpE n=1 Tax=Pelagovum pacificum TaxID=2588711 RepID=A0A5C5GE60_9RHOB|nr:carbohydrate ABC transporter permease [Pelagovum pacificum]QQA43870.1 carbohydrate ABC transporter permease [Pelagovum pacificum]TNY32998.1 carbohydrate ABC transporter permease [Pelagovum pacificum]